MSELRGHSLAPGLPSGAPVGVFDSGVGGLSVLRALLAELPDERFVYMADAGHAPYGEKGEAHAMDRSEGITRSLRETHGIKALVIACNTATAAAVARLREQHPDLPIVGVEPALKPAVAESLTRHVGVIGTRVTLSSQKFAALQASVAGDCRVTVVPCDGLADAIEQDDAERVQSLCQDYLQAMAPFGAHAGAIDQLVLGCTHYVFAAGPIADIAGADVRLHDTGRPVARQTRRVLEQAGRLAAAAGGPPAHDATRVRLLSSGEPAALARAALRWLALDTEAEAAPISGP